MAAAANNCSTCTYRATQVFWPTTIKIRPLSEDGRFRELDQDEVITRVKPSQGLLDRAREFAKETAESLGLLHQDFKIQIERFKLKTGGLRYGITAIQGERREYVSATQKAISLVNAFFTESGKTWKDQKVRMSFKFQAGFCPSYISVAKPSCTLM